MKRIVLVAIVLLLSCLFLICCEDEAQKISVEYVAGEGGTIGGIAKQEKELGEGGTVTFDAVVAKANSGYRFIGWDDGNTEKLRTDTLSQNATFVAKFEKIEYATVTYLCPEGGVLNGTSVQTLECGKTTTEVSVEPLEGYRFLGWSDGSMELSRTDVATEDITLTAMLTNKVIIKYHCTEGGKLVGKTEQTLESGDEAEPIKAVPDEGYRFAGWSDGFTYDARIDMATQDKEFTAIFKKYYKIEFACDEKEGTISGECVQYVDEGELAFAVVAQPRSGFEFICWSNGETNPKLSLVAESNVVVRAYFSGKSSGLPVISIFTENGVGITSKDKYVNCVVTVNDTDNGLHVIQKNAGIKGRGNSTWTKWEKDPYKIKFEDKQDLFGFGGARDWVLLANHFDRSLIRNYLVFEVAGEFSKLSSTTNSQPVELYVNGEYKGNYLLCEQVEVNEHRVEIDETESSSVVDTGYLVEMDGWGDGICVTVPDSYPRGEARKYSIKSPDIVGTSIAHREYIKQYLTNSLNAINGTDYEKVKELIDVDSFAQAYIIFELFKNPDVDYSSFYMHKDAGGKLMCGPVWDFDMCLGNVTHKGSDVQKYNYLWAKTMNPWFGGLLKHEEFVELVGKTLADYAPTIRSALQRCYNYVRDPKHVGGFTRNFERWDIMGETHLWEPGRADPSYITELLTWQEQVDFTEDYLEKSLDFLLQTYPAD